jgi:D-ribose pyranose/furanose isomerase RbsD
MLIGGILNPQINSLLSRVRHTNTVVIADRGFAFWPQIETIDLSLVDDIPTVLNPGSHSKFCRRQGMDGTRVSQRSFF